MSQSSDDRLQFSINESVWLRDDAPAEEILSMALEPDIAVEENWNDVTIKGYLRLTGEYKPSESTVEPDEIKPAPFRTIDEIMETNEGTAVLEHHFPIDITIPSDRVPDLENLYVVIESFDYELAEHRHIQLQADIAITGLTNPQTPEERKEKPVQKPKAPVPKEKPMVKAEKPVQPAAKKENVKPVQPATKKENVKPVQPAAKKENVKSVQPAAKKENVKPAQPALKKENVKPVQPAAKKENVKSAQPAAKKENAKPVQTAAKKDNQKGAVVAPGKAQVLPTDQNQPGPNQPKKKAEKGFAKFLKGKREEGPDASDVYDEEIFSGEYDEMPTDRQDDDEEGLTDFQYEAFRKPEAPEEVGTAPLVAFSERPEGDQPVNQVDEAGNQNNVADSGPGESKSEANSLYLTKVLAGDESDQKTRVKICIVQTGESLESISERYHVPVTSLLRKNALASASIEPGELLYIPKVAKGSKDE
ncbi:LysM peptidoglycan-binding domain-containing protein [Sporolactobacillus pectinivorans]|uniref:LysM peptidoglycan-binding domain-containing protein n=1 Tax=Sporolactobacillus pectinivorans TaxID=1591408 RepID=UPI000C2602F1|nr:LysM peptidoglycan-binding domain-containing protein [Sporolactobacillus pectinivorans]